MATVFERVLRDFKSKLPLEDRHNFSQATLSDLQLTIATVQKRQASTRTMQNMNRLKGFLEAMDTYSKIAETFVNVSDFVAFVWGPVKYLLLVASTFAESFNALLDAYQQIYENLPALQQYQDLFGDDPKMQYALEAIFQDIFEFHAKALKYFKGSAWKQLFQAAWKQFDAKFKDLLGNMQNHKRLIETHASLREFQEAKTARELAKNHFETNEKLENSKRKAHILHWLSAADYEADQEMFQEARRGNSSSGQWLLQHQAFKAWHESDTVFNPLLWISGIPGVGKTVLASRIIEETTSLQDRPCLYFYCRENDPQRNTFLGMARAFLAQAIQHTDSIVPYLFEVSTTGALTLSNLTLARNLLRTCLLEIQGWRIVLDGLDECAKKEQEHIASWLRQYINDSSINDPCRCVFFSQEDGSTTTLLSSFQNLRVTNAHTQQDISTFCATKAEELRCKFGLDEAQCTQIATSTTRSANGMFLFAKVVMNNLLEQPSLDALSTELKSNALPADLDQAYRRVLDRVLVQAPSGEAEAAKRLFTWITCATRPLRWRELQAAQSMDLEREQVNFIGRKFVVGAKYLCGAMVETWPNGEVNLIHLTAKRYLEKSDLVDLVADNLALAEKCLDYLNFPCFESNIGDSGIDAHISDGSYAFMDYAFVSWTSHILASCKSETSMQRYHRQVSALSETLGTFFESHWQEPGKKVKPIKALEEAVSTFPASAPKLKLLQSLAAMQSLLLGADRFTDHGEIMSIITTDLMETLIRVRSRMETLSDDQVVKLQEYYGSNLFKCTRIYCDWFHEGFKSRQQREMHKLEHDKPFLCAESNCLREVIGFSTKSQLDTHMREYHQPEPSEDTFPEDRSPTQRAQKRSGEHICSVCNKGFSKKNNLNTHQRTHANQSQFACFHCGKTYAREDNRDRHQKSHESIQKVMCKGTLDGGTEWGCGKIFGRADNLLKHLKSKTGNACRQHILDEQEDDDSVQNSEEVLQKLASQARTIIQPVTNLPSVKGAADTSDSLSSPGGPVTSMVPATESSVHMNYTSYDQQHLQSLYGPYWAAQASETSVWGQAFDLNAEIPLSQIAFPEAESGASIDVDDDDESRDVS